MVMVVEALVTNENNDLYRILQDQTSKQSRSKGGKVQLVDSNGSHYDIAFVTMLYIVSKFFPYH